ncbi:MAG: GTP-binding protein [Chloroflexi bacterium]|jgi:GTP-binding protein|nr:MAG: GTP-binding protein [Chloroflexota bacterium]
MNKPIIAIVGRPNVGKSTLFNRLVGHRVAVVAEEPGTTRDRISLDVIWQDRTFIIMDTGGLDYDESIRLSKEVEEQVEAAIDSADAIIFLTDARDGITSLDLAIGQRLRKSEKPIFMAVNKADNTKLAQNTAEFYGIKLGDPMPISAHHNLGIDNLMSTISQQLPKKTDEASKDTQTLSLAIIGRVNVGKSSLLNALLGEERAIVSDIPGTTRDSIDTRLQYADQRLLLIDTAGIRRRGKVVPGIEKFSVLRSVRSIDRADVIFFVMDATELATAQDTHIAGQITDAFKGVVIIVNKWDLAEANGVTASDCITEIRERFKFMPYAPIRFVSALEKNGISSAIEAAIMVFDDLTKEVEEEKLNNEVISAMSKHLPPNRGRRHLRVHKVLQEGINPPTFTFYVNYPDLVHFSYRRYLENRLREGLGFRWSHLKLQFKSRSSRNV